MEQIQRKCFVSNIVSGGKIKKKFQRNVYVWQRSESFEVAEVVSLVWLSHLLHMCNKRLDKKILKKRLKRKKTWKQMYTNVS